MDRRESFERNLLALSAADPELCRRLTGARPFRGRGRYQFLEARSGDPVPALVDDRGTAHPLHSLVDPRREAERLIAATTDAPADAGFLVFYGLGGGYHLDAALKREDVYQVLVIDYDIDGIAELLSSKEYVPLLKDPRFHLMVDSSPETLERCLPHLYQPVLYGGIRALPLRTRTSLDQARFTEAAEAVKRAIDAVSSDYSVQAAFGRRWFSNIIRNLFLAEGNAKALPPIRDAAICAAGPSLDAQIPLLIRRRSSRCILATDTSLPSLLAAGVEPDAVVSIDCQHISFQHFMAGLPPHIPLFLDLASPPVVAARSPNPRFFSGAHPLTRYICRFWRSFPVVDTSGGNVTYAALSLAETLGARRIELYGADFSYPRGITYARGTYLYPSFERRQNRLAPAESLHSAFLYRSPSLTRRGTGESWYYESRTLERYRERLEEKARALGTVAAIPGGGPPLNLSPEKTPPDRGLFRCFAAGAPAMTAAEFLRDYREKLAALPPFSRGISRTLGELGEAERLTLTTLLPAGAAFKGRRPDLKAAAALEEARSFCLEELRRVLAACCTCGFFA
ncbi:MAG: DUF115 domain-containing protein [Spirochaetaceae bacterium]|jgi:hypothetical protein|nr:DUF115 domain-containing protein [Spirochaetaceae bacterium]